MGLYWMFWDAILFDRKDIHNGCVILDTMSIK